MYGDNTDWPRAWERKKMGSNSLISMGFPFAVMEMIWKWWIHNSVKVHTYMQKYMYANILF